MSVLVTNPNRRSMLPLPEANIVTRLATMDDLPFIDSLQKQYSKQLGFFPRQQWEGYIRNGWVRVAVSAEGRQSAGDEGFAATNAASRSDALQGYIASRDRYLKRDELGAIFQLCVAPGLQRRFVGANLLRSVFEASPYGCRLYCCWCAQDLAANRFWEAMGFVPLAFRAGSREKSRVHIFWQKRIRDDATPWWFPSQTDSGAIREDRLVLPISPGMHWSDAKPMIYPEMTGLLAAPAPMELPGARARTKTKTIKPPPLPKDITAGGLRFVVETASSESKNEKTKREPKRKIKADPKLAAAARELRDRWLERINSTALPLPRAKYTLDLPTEPERLRLAAPQALAA